MTHMAPLLPLAPEVPSTQVVAALAADLRRLQEAASMDMALAAGRFIVERLNDEDPANLQRRDPRKVGLRILAAHPDVSVSAPVLYTCVAVYALTTRVRVVEAPRPAVLQPLSGGAAAASRPAVRPTVRQTVRPGKVSPAGRSAGARLETSTLTSYRFVQKLLHSGVAAVNLAETIVRQAAVSRDLAQRIALLCQLPAPWKRRLKSTAAATIQLTLDELLARSGLVPQGRLKCYPS